MAELSLTTGYANVGASGLLQDQIIYYIDEAKKIRAVIQVWEDTHSYEGLLWVRLMRVDIDPQGHLDGQLEEFFSIGRSRAFFKK